MSMLSDAEIDDYEYRLRIGQTLLPQEIAALAAQAKSHAAVAEVVEPNNLVARLRFEGQGKYTNRPSYQKMDAMCAEAANHIDALRTALTHATLAKEAAEKEVERLTLLIERKAEAAQQLIDRLRLHEQNALAAEQRAAAMEAALNSPETENFVRCAYLEACHQIERWGTAHDRGKAPSDWFWLIGHLAGKALQSHVKGDTDKALHHCISSAAALCNWHAAIKGVDVRMCPGKSDIEKILAGAFGDAAIAAQSGSGG